MIVIILLCTASCKSCCCCIIGRDIVRKSKYGGYLFLPSSVDIRVEFNSSVLTTYSSLCLLSISCLRINSPLIGLFSFNFCIKGANPAAIDFKNILPVLHCILMNIRYGNTIAYLDSFQFVM